MFINVIIIIITIIIITIIINSVLLLCIYIYIEREREISYTSIVYYIYGTLPSRDPPQIVYLEARCSNYCTYKQIWKSGATNVIHNIKSGSQVQKVL